MDFILEVMKDIITKEKEVNDLSQEESYSLKGKEPSYEVLTGYQRLAEMDISIRIELNDLGFEEKNPVVASKDQSHIILILNITKKHLLSKPTATKVLDAYYNLNKSVKELLDNTRFGSNKKQDNNLELKKVMKFGKIVGYNGSNRPKEESQNLNDCGAEIDHEKKSENDESDNVDNIDKTIVDKENYNEKNNKKEINKKKQNCATKITKNREYNYQRAAINSDAKRMTNIG
ncbi:28722_t:CDS:2, partial [Gigaspora margarita]